MSNGDQEESRGPKTFIVNSEGDAKVVAMLSRIDERVNWMRGDAEKRERQIDLMFGILDQLRQTTATLKATVETLSEESREAAALVSRVVALESAGTELRKDVDESTAFIKNAVRYAAIIGVLALLGDRLGGKLLAAMGVSL